MTATVASPGTWLLFVGRDARLVQVGETPVGPVNPNKITSVPLRFGLLPAVTHAIDGVQHEGRVSAMASGHEWHSHIRPIRSPFTNTVIAVQAILMPRGEEPPRPPLVGSWEWIIKLDEHGRPTPHRLTYWDRNLFQLYRISPDAPERSHGCWEVPVWSNELIHRNDQARLMGQIRDGIKNTIDGTRSLTYGVHTGRGTDKPGDAQLRLVGQISSSSPEGTLALQGVSFEVDPTFTEPSLERDGDDARVDDALRAVIQLSEKHMCLVDPASMEILATSQLWKDEGFGRVSTLVEVFDEQGEDLHDFIGAAAQSDNTIEFPRLVALYTADGRSKTARLKACGFKFREGGTRDVGVSLEF